MPWSPGDDGGCFPDLDAETPGDESPGYANEVPPGLRTGVDVASVCPNPGGVSFP